MTRITMIKALTRLAFCVALGAALTGCQKTEDTIAIVIVVDEDGNLVEGASVELFADITNPTGDPTRLNKTGTSNIAGEVRFDYTEFYKEGQSGFAVLDILATKASLLGEGIIKIEEEKTNRETVVLEVP